MNVNDLIERPPRPTSDYDRLVELLAELGVKRAEIRLDGNTFARFRAQKARPYRPLPSEWTTTAGAGLVTFKEMPE